MSTCAQEEIGLIGFGTTQCFRHPMEVLEHVPVAEGGSLYLSQSLSHQSAQMQQGSTVLLMTAVLKQLVPVRLGHLGRDVGPMAEKWASELWAIFLHTHMHTHTHSELKQLFQQALDGISVCFLVTWSASKLFFLVFSFLKENTPWPKYGIHLHCNPKWSTDSFPLDLCFAYSHSLSFLMDNDWKQSPVGISTALFETDVLETTDTLSLGGRSHSRGQTVQCCTRQLSHYLQGLSYLLDQIRQTLAIEQLFLHVPLNPHLPQQEATSKAPSQQSHSHLLQHPECGFRKDLVWSNLSMETLLSGSKRGTWERKMNLCKSLGPCS